MRSVAADIACGFLDASLRFGASARFALLVLAVELFVLQTRSERSTYVRLVDQSAGTAAIVTPLLLDGRLSAHAFVLEDVVVVVVLRVTRAETSTGESGHGARADGAAVNAAAALGHCTNSAAATGSGAGLDRDSGNGSDNGKGEESSHICCIWNLLRYVGIRWNLNSFDSLSFSLGL